MKYSLLLILAVCLVLSVTVLAEQLVLYSEAGAGFVMVSVEGPDRGYGVPNLPVVTDKSPIWTTIDGASWIASSKIRETNGKYGSWRMFTREFTVPGTGCSSQISATIEIAADNAYTILCNGVLVGDSGLSGSTNAHGSVSDVNTVAWTSGPFPFQMPTKVYKFKPKAGTNILEILVRNWNTQPDKYNENKGNSNPTGLLYKVVIDYNTITNKNIDTKQSIKIDILDSNNISIVPDDIID
jgi:hypothetical protein